MSFCHECDGLTFQANINETSACSAPTNSISADNYYPTKHCAEECQISFSSPTKKDPGEKNRHNLKSNTSLNQSAKHNYDELISSESQQEDSEIERQQELVCPSPGSMVTPLQRGSKQQRVESSSDPTVRKAKRALPTVDSSVQNAAGYLKKVRVQPDPACMETEDCNAVIEQVHIILLILRLRVSTQNNVLNCLPFK